MNNNNIVKIGTALKWRNEFDLTKKYYQENIVTMCGCVFRCKVLQTQGKSPLEISDERGHIVYINTDVWDVVVDMARYYNFAVDSNNNTQDALQFAQGVAEQLDGQQCKIDTLTEEVEVLKKRSRKQNKLIKKIQTINKQQQKDIETLSAMQVDHSKTISELVSRFNCLIEGNWHNDLLWDNEAVWQNGCNCLKCGTLDQADDTDQRISSLENLINKLTTLCDEQSKKIDSLQQQIDNLQIHKVEDKWNNDYVWNNELNWPEVLTGLENEYDIYVEEYDEATNTLYLKCSDLVTITHDNIENILTFASNKQLIQEYCGDTGTIIFKNNTAEAVLNI